MGNQLKDERFPAEIGFYWKTAEPALRDATGLAVRDYHSRRTFVSIDELLWKQVNEAVERALQAEEARATRGRDGDR